MERITLLVAPPSGPGKLWMALHLPLAVMAGIVATLCTSTFLMIVNDPPFTWNDTHNPRRAKNVRSIAAVLALCAAFNLTTLIYCGSVGQAAARRHWEARVLRVKTHATALAGLATASAITGIALLCVLLFNKEIHMDLDPVIFLGSVYTAPILFAAAIVIVELVYVRSHGDGSRWNENMFTLASKDHRRDDVQAWSLTAPAWRFLEGIKICHKIMLVTVALCFTFAGTRFILNVIVLAVAVPLFYFSGKDNLEEALRVVPRRLFGLLWLAAQSLVSGLAGSQLLTYCNEFGSVSSARILRPKFNLPFLAVTALCASSIVPTIGSFFMALLTMSIALPALVAIGLESIIVQQSADPQRWNKNMCALVKGPISLADDV